MFALRGVALSLSVFVLLYFSLSSAVCKGWRGFYLSVQRHRMHRVADWLFALRMLPFAASIVITLAFTIPSFLMFEPRVIAEPVGDIPLVLGLAGAFLAIFGLAKAAVALLRVSRTVSVWTNDAEPLDFPSRIPVLRIRPGDPCHDGRGHPEPENSSLPFCRVSSESTRITDSVQSRSRTRESPR